MGFKEWEWFSHKFDALEASIKEIRNKLTQMEATLMSQLDDLNTAIQAEDVEITTLLASVTKIDADVDALLAKIAAGATLPDITTQLTAIQAHTAALTTAAQQLADEDAKANPPAAQ